MPTFHTRRLVALAAIALSLAISVAVAQSAGNSGSINGSVVDPTGAVVPNAKVEIRNPVTGFDRSTTTDASGKFSFTNIPFNNYHLRIKAAGFADYAQDVEPRSAVPINVAIKLQVSGLTTTVTVEAGGDLVENDSTAHTDVDKGAFDRLPLESASSSLSSAITLYTPGIAADSNGLFHSLGDHAENSFSIDGQPITDQQSKVFSNQIPLDSIQSMEVIPGAPPAEYGGKTSLIVNVTTQSGQGQTTPHGTVTAAYGSFGTANTGFTLGYGGQNWGNFISLSGLNSGRFLDPPEFAVMHDKGNEENLFDRVDYQLSTANSLHVNFGYTRSWFQNPNSFDQQFHNVNGVPLDDPVTGNPLGGTDQVSQIKTFNIAPTWTRLLNSTTVFTLGAFVRRDQYNYYPSANAFNDLAPDLQGETVSQNRKLTNAGLRSYVSYVKGIHNLKVGGTYTQTFLDEVDGIGIVDPTLVPGVAPSCLSGTGQPIPGTPCAVLAPYDLTGGGGLYGRGGLFSFNGHTDVKELAFYAQDTITKGNWAFNLGMRGDFYNALARDRQAEPRVGVAYNIKATNTVLRVSYARTMESPFNENLVIASTGCSIPFLAVLVPPPGVPCVTGPITPGYRNEFHAGLQQAFGHYLVLSGDYIWKYTHNGYDFGTVGSTPITFPIEWHNAKIPGFALRVSVPNYRGFSAQVVMSSVAARFFLPQVAGLPIIPPATGVFRIDHDEKYNQTTHIQYQPWKTGPWFGFNWRYDSGLVAGATPCLAPTATCSLSTSTLDGGANPNIPSGYIALVNAISGAPLTADQEFQAGFTCNGMRATPTQALPSSCLATQFGSTLIKIPGPNTENDDHNPQRIAPRSLFDLALGHDNLFRGDKYKVSGQITVVNLANRYALYNFLSTFSGTHYVTPRSITAQLAFHF
ncbi:MAG TPA: TonB-dependent receptor [Candidatus Sulfotelmatobacter sp.]|nr:TonB-dependent receptor [Candidatus Sulfotelmatobacter sp.]